MRYIRRSRTFEALSPAPIGVAAMGVILAVSALGCTTTSTSATPAGSSPPATTHTVTSPYSNAVPPTQPQATEQVGICHYNDSNGNAYATSGSVTENECELNYGGSLVNDGSSQPAPTQSEREGVCEYNDQFGSLSATPGYVTESECELDYGGWLVNGGISRSQTPFPPPTTYPDLPGE